MKSTIDVPYTPEVVEQIFKLWPEFDAAREEGTLGISISGHQRLEAANEVSSMMPRGLRASNTFYQIDGPASIICDIELACEKVISPKTQSRLRRFHYDQFTLEEIALEDQVTFKAVDFSLKLAYRKISEELERVKEPKHEPHYKYEEPTHMRKYWQGMDIPRVR